MANLDKKDTATLEKFQLVIDEYERDKFTQDEIEVLHHMIKLWEAFEVLGKVANIGRNVIIYLAGILILWFTPFDVIIKAAKKAMGLE